MSALLNSAARTVLEMTVGVGAPDHFDSGLPYEADGSIAAAATTPTHHHQGLGFDAEGRLCVLEGATPDYFGSGAAPFLAITPDRLCVQAAAVDHYSTGVPYTATGRVAYTAP